MPQSTSNQMIRPTDSESRIKPPFSGPDVSNSSPIGTEHDSCHENYQIDPNTSDHHQVQRSSQFVCVDCNQSFSDKTSLDFHAHFEKHSRVECSCGAKFVRQDASDRHCNSFSKDARRFPCPICKRYRGNQAFRRRDHLLQHLRGYHKYEPEIRRARPRKIKLSNCRSCSDPGCESYRDKAWRTRHHNRGTHWPFRKQSDYDKHVKGVHKLTPFPCPVAECERVGAKGYVAASGLVKHLANQHPDAPQHLEDFRETCQRRWWQCDSCDEGFWSIAYFKLHCRLAH
ncbi:hypothetical protein GGS26DRAFT_206714 [Hypomontagnella submonticulosa]|nr:hypothetical protein GGS26DRAFT_206714 [Hypomontagnella submonticulosa]